MQGPPKIRMATPRPLTQRLVLASGSPRRRHLIMALDLPVDSVSPDVSEGDPRPGETPHRFVVRLSAEKARQLAGQVGDAVVLGADTAVVLDEEVLGKPDSKAQATLMLRALRGRTHWVVTGVTVLDTKSGHWLSAARCTDVTMRSYSDQELAAYVESGTALDKAGGYAVQDDRFRPAKCIHGCYLNVVGLPLCEVVRLLEGLGAPVRLRPGWQPPKQCADCPLEERQEVM